MKALSQEDLKENILKILEMVKNGEDVLIEDEPTKEKVAVMISYKKYKDKENRPLGILKGKASYKIKNGFKMSDEELLLT